MTVDRLANTTEIALARVALDPDPPAICPECGRLHPMSDVGEAEEESR